jgi:hypothetical protein
MNASCHGCLDQWADVLVLNGSLVLSESTFLISVDLGDILKIALTSLITNWAIQGMIGKEEFHYTTSGNSCSFGFGDNFEVWSDLCGTGSKRLWCSLYLHQTHSAVTGNRESLVVAESWNFNSTAHKPRKLEIENDVQVVNCNLLKSLLTLPRRTPGK